MTSIPVPSLLIDGRKLALTIRNGLKARVQALRDKHVIPRLEVVLVGDNPASLIYVNMKQRAAKNTGISCTIHRLADTSTEQDVIRQIRELNRPDVHGILLQLPVPKHMNSVTLLNQIEAMRDIDGLTIANVGRRTIGLDALLPCTPKGCIKLIKSVQPDMTGMHAAVIGRSDLVGKPMAQLLLRENCTVTQVHKHTQNPQALCRQADIVVVAIGSPRFITRDWIKPGAIVIDVGINRVGNKVVGDVDFDNIRDVAQAITPVPGGVGPMTVACLLENIVEVAEKQLTDISV